MKELSFGDAKVGNGIGNTNIFLSVKPAAS
jgi:hypothetical protein